MKQLNVNLMHPVEQINLIISKIYRSGMTTTSGGNISIRDDNGDIWITPSAVDKGSLTTKDIVLVKKDGTIFGQHKPSSEFPFHKAIYEARPELNAVIHAHPPALVAFSITHTIMNTNSVPHYSDICGNIGFAPYGTPGSQDLGRKIADEFKNKSHKAVIMENHGVVIGGTDLKDAYKLFETLEYCSRTIIKAQQLGELSYLTKNQLNEYVNYFPEIPSSFEKVKYSSKERALRSDIVKIIHRACDQGLMISSYGTVSARFDDDDFLITSHNLFRLDADLDDIVQIKQGNAEVGKIPSKYADLHQRIYQLNPHINSIICSMPVNLMAYAVSRTKFDVRTIPESWIFLQDVPSIPIDIVYNNIDETARLFNNNRVIIVENECVIATGDKLLNAFDYLEVAEFTANSLIMAASIGKLEPIGNEEIEDLRIAFNIK